jgi:iron complex outermembrane receptor protein
MKKLYPTIRFSAVLYAQNSVSGTVTNMTNQPVSGVSVYAPELHKGTTTDENGKFSLTNLPNGTVKLSFTFVRFHNSNKTIKGLEKENTLDVILEETIFQMDAVIVSTAFNKIQSKM